MKKTGIIMNGEKEQWYLTLSFGEYGNCRVCRKLYADLKAFEHDFDKMHEYIDYCIYSLSELLEKYSIAQDRLLERFVVMVLRMTDRADKKEAVEIARTALNGKDWDLFLSRYWQVLMWGEQEHYWKGGMYYMRRKNSNGIHPVDYGPIMLELPLQYKVVVNKLLYKEEWETLLFLRIMMETGIRMRDVSQIRICNFHKRKLVVQNSKRLADAVYMINYHLPRISKKTEKIVRILMKKQGCLFTKSADYYRRRIGNEWEQPEFRIFLLRHYRVREIGK